MRSLTLVSMGCRIRFDVNLFAWYCQSNGQVFHSMYRWRGYGASACDLHEIGAGLLGDVRNGTGVGVEDS